MQWSVSLFWFRWLGLAHLLHEEVAWAFDRVVRVLHSRWRLVLVRIGQALRSVVLPCVMVRRSPGVETASLWADRAAIALRASRAVGRAELIRIMSWPVPILDARLRAGDPHVHSGIVRRHLVRILLELIGSLASDGAHVLAAAD